MARHTRWPAGKDWLPEAFRQLGANTHEYREPTPEEQANQWIRMFVDRKISREALLKYFYGPEGRGDSMLQYKPMVYLIEASHEAPYYINDDGSFNDEKLRNDLRPYAGRIWS